MAAHPSAPGVCKLTFIFLCSDRNFGDSLYVSKPTPVAWTNTELNSLAAAAFTAWSAHMMTTFSISCTLVAVVALDLSDDTGRQFIHEGTTSGSLPADTNPPLAMSSVARVTFQVPRRYRGGKPGINISGRTTTDLQDERTFVTDTANLLLDQLTTTITQILADCPPGSFQCAVSYIAAGVIRVAPLVLPVINSEIQKRVCSLRKRLGKGIAELFG